MISVNESGTATANGASGVTAASMSADLRHVTFFSDASDLVPSTDNNDVADIYVRDRTEGVTKLISYSPVNAVIGNGNSFAPFISADGSVIVFATEASNLASNDFNFATDIVATSLTNTLPSSAALVAQAIGPRSVPLGTEFPVTLSVVNFGAQPVTAVSLAALMSPNVQCVNSTGDGSFDAASEIWSIDNIPSLQAASLNLTVRAIAGDSGFISGRITSARNAFGTLATKIASPVLGTSFNITEPLSAVLVGPVAAGAHPWQSDLANGRLQVFAGTPEINGATTVVSFNADILGALTTKVGLLYNSGNGAGLEAVDALGRRIATLPLPAGGAQFVGIEREEGIGGIRLSGDVTILQVVVALEPGVPVPDGIILWGRGAGEPNGRIGTGYSQPAEFSPAKELVNGATLEFWVRPDLDLDQGSSWTPLAVSVPDGQDFNSRARGPDIYYSAGSLGFALPVVNGLVREVIEHPVTLSAGRWHHVAGVINAGIQTLYLDGRAVESRALTAPVSFSPSSIRIGAVAYFGNNRGFDGSLDEVALFDRALPPATIAAIANPHGPGKVSPDLRATREDGVTILAWPSFFSGYRLQTASNIGQGEWRDWPVPAVLRNGAWQVSLPETVVFHYYRITRPAH
ncbi:MAG: LamG-like jellyroll fold domain-containing protein [Limisphaerales bacterium]